MSTGWWDGSEECKRSGAADSYEVRMLVRFLGEVQEDNLGWVADWNIMSCKHEHASLLIDPKGRKVISSLVARIEKVTRGCEVEAAWVVASRPFVRKECQFPRCGDPKDADAVVQSISDIDKTTVL